MAGVPLGSKRTGRRATAECFVAACCGTARLTERVGAPVVLVGVSKDAEASIAELNRRRHGSGTLWPQMFQPLEPQSGWDDWAMFALEPPAVASLPECESLAFTDGRIKVGLPRGVALSELREQVMAALSPLRYHDVVRSPRWLEAASDADPLADIVVHPRYVFSGADFRGASLCTDLFVLDPSEEAPKLAWTVAAARSAAQA